MLHPSKMEQSGALNSRLAFRGPSHPIETDRGGPSQTITKPGTSGYSRVQPGTVGYKTQIIQKTGKDNFEANASGANMMNMDECR